MSENDNTPFGNAQGRITDDAMVDNAIGRSAAQLLEGLDLSDS